MEGTEDNEVTFSSSQESNISVNYISGNKVITVDGGDLSGHREANVKVDICFGEREYWVYTNGYGQLVRVEAKEIVLQDDNTEPVTVEASK